MSKAQALLEKIQALPAERVSEVEDFVEFLLSREQGRWAAAAAAASEPSFAKFWNNPEDDVYDAL